MTQDEFLNVTSPVPKDIDIRTIADMTRPDCYETVHVAVPKSACSFPSKALVIKQVRRRKTHCLCSMHASDAPFEKVVAICNWYSAERRKRNVYPAPKGMFEEIDDRFMDEVDAILGTAALVVPTDGIVMSNADGRFTFVSGGSLATKMLTECDIARAWCKANEE